MFYFNFNFTICTWYANENGIGVLAGLMQNTVESLFLS
jgi:hypothetical protein